MKDKGHLNFDVQNQTFSQQFTFKKHKFIGLLIILNARSKETLALKYHIEKKGKKKKKIE